MAIVLRLRNPDIDTHVHIEIMCLHVCIIIFKDNILSQKNLRKFWGKTHGSEWVEIKVEFASFELLAEFKGLPLGDLQFVGFSSKCLFSINLRLGEKIEAAWVRCSAWSSQLCPKRKGYRGQACGHPWRLGWEHSEGELGRTDPKRPITFICKVIITPPIFYKLTIKQVTVDLRSPGSRNGKSLLEMEFIIFLFFFLSILKNNLQYLHCYSTNGTITYAPYFARLISWVNKFCFFLAVSSCTPLELSGYGK